MSFHSNENENMAAGRGCGLCGCSHRGGCLSCGCVCGTASALTCPCCAATDVDARAAGLVEVTDPEVLSVGVSAGWADPETDPARIDWRARQAAALIPFRVTTEGRPVSPTALTAPTGITRGRNGLGRWGENAMADALVTATTPDGRWVLLVERVDGHGWAVPGGAIEVGESPLQAAARELAEETGLALPVEAWESGRPMVVPDPRASDEAWAVTVVARADLGSVDVLPDVAGADDAARAEWVRADFYAALEADLLRRFDRGSVFAAHVDLLRRELQVLEAADRFTAMVEQDRRAGEPMLAPSTRYWILVSSFGELETDAAIAAQVRAVVALERRHIAGGGAL